MNAWTPPNDTQRIVVVGATGSGKTQAAMRQLSYRSFETMPWIIYDFKYDELIEDIVGIQEIGVNTDPPTRPGLYVCHPTPEESLLVDLQMKKIWQNGHTGVFVDEAYMLKKDAPGFRSLLTQGRSLITPIITCTQRPVWIDRFVFSEASFFQVFRLQHRKDVDIVGEYIPFHDTRGKSLLHTRLPEFSSYYYSVAANTLNRMGPVPDREAILTTFDTKLRKLKKAV